MKTNAIHNNQAIYGNWCNLATMLAWFIFSNSIENVCLTAYGKFSKIQICYT